MKTTTTREADTATYMLPTRDAAWAFVHACDARGISAGFPELKSRVPYAADARAVSVALPTCGARELADTLANGAPVIEYKFGK